MRQSIIDIFDKWCLLNFEDEDWTKWIQSIQKAKVYLLQNKNENWLDDDSCIQIKRMTVHDLPNPETIDEVEHPYEETMDVVKLPMPVPECRTDIGSQFLFLRPDDYHLFYCMQQSAMEQRVTNKFILLGNPDISKSWFHFKYILFCYRPEIYNTFRPIKDDEDVERTPESKKTKVLIMEIPRSIELKGINTIPQVIVRTIRGTISQIFFVNSFDSVITVKHQTYDLQDFTTQEMTILWEPAETKTRVPYIGIEALMIVTASPFLDQFKGLQKKGARVLHMPCPSELHLRYMGQVLRPIYLELINSDVEIQRRVKSFGPFIRLVLNHRRDRLREFTNYRDDELKRYNSSQLTNMVTLNQHVMVTNGAQLNGFSDQLVCYFVRRNNEKRYFGYETKRFRCACEDAYRAINSKISKPDIQVIQSHLVYVNTSCGDSSALEEFQLELLKRLVAYYIETEGLKWERCIMPSKTNEAKRGSFQDSTQWMEFRLQQMEIVHDLVPFNKMVFGKMYVPDTLQFPLFDMYWKDENGELCGIQVIKSKQHPQMFKSLLEDKLGLESMDIRFHLHYVIFPYHKEDFEANSLWPSSLNQKAITMHPNFGGAFTFYALCPPSTFNSYLSRFH